MSGLARALAAARRVRGLPGPDRLLLAEAATALGLARLAVTLLPFRVVARALGREGPVPDGLDGSAGPAGRQAGAPGRVGWAVVAAARVVPWPATCLVQTLAASRMLALRRVGTVAVLGVDRDGGELRAHAWLKAGPVIVTGAPVHAGFTPVAVFASGGTRT